MKLALGKREYRHDPKTLLLIEDEIVATDVKVPDEYDYDKGKRPFPVSIYGNDAWGNCVVVGRANHANRQERLERGRTPSISPSDVILEYQNESEREFGARPIVAGDAHDNGLIVLYSMRNWRNIGWKIRAQSGTEFIHKINAYGEVSGDKDSMKRAVYLLRGLHLGLNLPQTAAVQIRNGQPWESVPTDAFDAQPGSWGGHLVYVPAYTARGLVCITWGRRQLVTWDFLTRYCDERWAVVDGLDSEKITKRMKRWLDIPALEKYLSAIALVNR